jgi:DNA-binding transcriptional MerR regulator
VATKGVNAMNKSAEAFRTIGEVAGELGIPKHVLRFWEGRFPQIRPMKRGGGRRYYRPEDMELLRGIRALLHSEGYTIKGVQKILREQGIDQVKAAAARLSTAQSQGAAAKRASRQRGRKPRASAAKEMPPHHKAREPREAESISTRPTRLASKVQVLAAIRELEIARVILLGLPLDQAAGSAGAKKARAGRP